jgi:hypothetical protein
MAYVPKLDAAVFEIANFILIHHRVPLRCSLGGKHGYEKKFDRKNSNRTIKADFHLSINLENSLFTSFFL